MSSRRAWLACCAAVLAAWISTQAAAGPIWDGGDPNDNFWTSGANWNTVGIVQAPPPNNGTANGVMAGTVRLTPNVDVAWDIRSLKFNVLAGAFTIESPLQNALTIGVGGMLNQSGLLQTLNAEIVLGGDWLTGGANYDLFIDAGDASVLFAALGQSFDPGFAPAAVPEPGALTLGLLGLLMCLTRKRACGRTRSE